MKNFLFGLLFGLLTTNIYFMLVPDLRVIKNTAATGSSSLYRQPNHSTNSNDKPHDTSSHESSRHTSEAINLDTNSLVSAEAQSSVKSNATINRILNNLTGMNSQELEQVESILSSLNNKTPDEKFELESIDSDWSLTKQAELEYSFYENSLLNDLGTLESITCKTQSCQARISVPIEFELKSSHFLDWSNPVSTILRPNPDDPNSKLIVIYINRE